MDKPEKAAVGTQGTGKAALKVAKSSAEDSFPSSRTRGITEMKPEAEVEDHKSTDKKTMSKSTTKREHSDIFKSISMPKAKFTREDTGSSTGTSLAASAVPALKQVRPNPVSSKTSS